MSSDCPPCGLVQAALLHSFTLQSFTLVQAALLHGYVGSLLSVNDANGHALGQPPLRLTRGIARWTVPTARVHTALRAWAPFTSPDGSGGSVVMSTHLAGALSDRECRTSEGGVRCQLLTLPTGTP